jgi:S-DNA-T family DNA segregation ATPase FtsK/SpoIIIE
LRQASKTQQEIPVPHMHRRLREGAMLLLLAVGIYLLLSLVTFAAGDPGWSYTGTQREVSNAGGPVGAWIADVFLNLFGFLAYLLPLMVPGAAGLSTRSVIRTTP